MKKQILTIAMLSIAVVSFAQRYKGTVSKSINKTISIYFNCSAGHQRKLFTYIPEFD